MKCIFCNELLKEEEVYAKDLLEVFACRDCKRPAHSTVYRQIYYKGKRDLIQDLIMVDYWCITRWYKSDTNSNGYSLIYKDVIGVMRGLVSLHNLDPEPVSINAPVCKIDHIVNIDTTNLKSFRHKLSTWITFS